MKLQITSIKIIYHREYVNNSNQTNESFDFRITLIKINLSETIFQKFKHSNCADESSNYLLH